jgi:hypothetical protein
MQKSQRDAIFFAESLKNLCDLIPPELGRRGLGGKKFFFQ